MSFDTHSMVCLSILQFMQNFFSLQLLLMLEFSLHGHHLFALTVILSQIETDWLFQAIAVVITVWTMGHCFFGITFVRMAV
ncbi:hypothetical protein DFH08DRAFT_970467 [Mycena albidolilacea]|uniref:Uncharacterized protein n=1 Tax=Mycena albidolilacea TaxID=1033008 RepID=A0AAD6ZF73_9AGAR|nr:hypothetical protein DFH08DRAFT_970467 [Mycena albidolilacea]